MASYQSTGPTRATSHEGCVGEGSETGDRRVVDPVEEQKGARERGRIQL